MVSVVVPAWNAERTVVRALRSVLDQGSAVCEVVVVDDASSDRTAEVARSLGDPRVRVVSQPENRGACAARNTGAALAGGTWLTYVDADDWIGPGRLARMVAAGEAQSADVVADDVYWTSGRARPGPDGTAVGPDGRELALSALFSDALRSSLPRWYSGAEFVMGNLPGRARLNMGLMKPVFRRVFLAEHDLEWDEAVRVGQDTVFYTDVLAAGARWWMTPEAGYYYVQNADGISKTSDPIAAVTGRILGNDRLRARHGRDRELNRSLQRRGRALSWALRRARFEAARETAGRVAAAARHPLGALDVAVDRSEYRLRRWWARLAPTADRQRR